MKSKDLIRLPQALLKYVPYVILLTLYSSAHGSPFDGEWKVIFDCTGATGIYAEKCARGNRDIFYLSLKSSEENICGSHLATAHLNNRVDSGEQAAGNKPTIIGSYKGNLATVKYQSALGGGGLAEMKIENSQLHWKVIEEDTGRSWFPDEAILKKISSTQQSSLPCIAGEHK